MIGPLLQAGFRAVYYGYQGMQAAIEKNKLLARMTPQERRICDICTKAIKRRERIRRIRAFIMLMVFLASCFFAFMSAILWLDSIDISTWFYVNAGLLVVPQVVIFFAIN